MKVTSEAGQTIDALRLSRGGIQYQPCASDFISFEATIQTTIKSGIHPNN
jgi:hypothetical protein